MFARLVSSKIYCGVSISVLAKNVNKENEMLLRKNFQLLVKKRYIFNKNELNHICKIL